MQPDSSGSLIDRIIAWLRGLFGAGRSATDAAARDVRRTAHQASSTVRDGVGDAERRVRDGVGDADRRMRDSVGDADRKVREGVGDAERKVRDVTDRRGTATRGDRNGSELPDLADESSGGGRSTFDSATSSRNIASTYSSTAPSTRDVNDEAVDRRSDFDDASGDLVTGDETYPPSGAELDSATHVHDAVGGEDTFADDATDGTIDTTRDADLRPAGAESFQDREIPLQDQLIVDEGASSDEFDGDEITAGAGDDVHVTSDDVEAAAEGYGDVDDTNLANTSADGTSTLTGSTYTETDVDVPPTGAGEADRPAAADADQDTTPLEDAGSFQVVERYNYGEGDLGVGAGTTPDRAWDHDGGEDVSTADISSGVDADINAARGDAGADAASEAVMGEADTPASDGIDASVSPEATRTEIESQSRGDAVNRSDEATQTPGFGDPETFASDADGTTEPSRSATGDDVDDEQDALGTTLDYSEESDAFSEEAADLSGEDEMTISDENVDFGAERVATFQSGTIAQEGGLASGEATIDEEVTDEAYADLPDEPAAATADDAGVDDLAGSNYPSDRVVDTLDGDDFTDAETPDVPDLDSSAGDLDVASADASAQVEYVSEPVERTVGDAGAGIDEDVLAATDQTVGEDIPESEAGAGSELDESAGTATLGVAAASDQVLDSTRDSRSAGQAGTGSAPAGSVPGDGGTVAPEGYPIKGNADSMIYHLPEYPSYKSTKAEFYFATEEDAVAAGYRAPGNVRHGHAAGSAAASAVGSVTADTGSQPDDSAVGSVTADTGSQPDDSASSTATSASDTVAADTGAISGDETSHIATGEVAFDERLSDVQPVASDAATGDSAPAESADLAAGAASPAGAELADDATTTQDADLTAGTASPAGAELADDATTTSRGADLPAGAVPGDGTAVTPAGYPVKGNASSMIYHLPEFPSYRATKPEFCFATEQDALNAGYRAPANAHRGGHAAGSAASNAAAALDDAEQANAVNTDQALSDSEPGASSSETVAAQEADAGTRLSAEDAAGSDATTSDADIPAGAVRGDGGTEPPAGYPIKGNASSMIYHLPSFPSYKSTKAEFYFASEEDAVAAGFRAPGKRNRGKKH